MAQANLKLKRLARKSSYTIGRLFLDGVYLCDTLEDKDRGLKSTMSLGEVKRLKVKAQTAIPTGSYVIDMNTVSGRFGSKAFYKEVCGGRVPRLQNVLGYEGVLIHCGNTDRDTEGCILVGENKAVGRVINSQATFRKVYRQLLAAKKAGKTIVLTIE